MVLSYKESTEDKDDKEDPFEEHDTMAKSQADFELL